MPSITSFTRVTLAAFALATPGLASALCNNIGNKGCNTDCDCDCGYVCQPGPGGGCKIAATNPSVPGHCDVNFTSCACRVGFGSTVDQTCVAGTCHPTWFELLDAGDLIIVDAGPPPVPACQFDFDCGCGAHCAFNPADGGNQCVAFADSPGGATGGFCHCADNTAGSCVAASCGCPGDTCSCDAQNCDDGGAGTCHPADAGPIEPPDAGKDCTVDIDCGNVCGSVCSHAMTYWLCIQGSSDQGFCFASLDCPCTDELCDPATKRCTAPAVDAGVDAGTDAGSGGTTGGTTGGGTTTGGTTGGGSSGCSSGGGLAGLGVLGLIGAALLSRRRQLAGRS